MGILENDLLGFFLKLSLQPTLTVKAGNWVLISSPALIGLAVVHTSRYSIPYRAIIPAMRHQALQGPRRLQHG